MRDEHNEGVFSSDVLGCARKGRRAYFKKKDLHKHRQQEHPEAVSYVPIGKRTDYRCTEPGCDVVLDMSSIQYHAAMHKVTVARHATQTTGLNIP